MLTILKWLLGIIFVLVILLAVFLWLAVYHPSALQPEKVYSSDNLPQLNPGQKLKILNWNVQYMASKNYIFFYDILDGSGPDTRPSKKDIDWTLKEVAKIIVEEDPDIILLQEVDEGSKRTDFEDQLKRLLTLLPKHYAAHTSCWYWWVYFVPHPRIMGKVGMKQCVISKYQIKSAIRHQLPLIETENWFVQQFNLKRAIQEVHFPVKNRKDFIVFNTHLSAFAQGSKNMENQIRQTHTLLTQSTALGHSWVIGGDFNLLPPGKAYSMAPPRQQKYYNPKSEIGVLFRDFQPIPNQAEVDSSSREQWFTHFPNDPQVKAPDRTIDYLFLSKDLVKGKHYVRQQGTLRISDHLPVITEITLPK
jgi:endonuclease/exonuclease/phosphatase family metal-dependent hydrolase